LQVDYQVTQSVQASVGGRNLTDREYQLAAGFPEVGRTMFAKVRADF
jgi:iron complex outermembrane receptor protein